MSNLRKLLFDAMEKSRPKLHTRVCGKVFLMTLAQKHGHETPTALSIINMLLDEFYE